MKRATWYYHFTWELEDKSLEDTIDLTEDISLRIMEWCKSFDLALIQCQMVSNQLQIQCTTSSQLNTNKVLKAFKKIERSFGELQLVRSISKPIGDSTKDSRVSKLLDTLWSVEYYDLDEGVTQDLKAFKEFLTHRKLVAMDIGEQLYLVDTVALEKEINLNCFECTRLYGYGCCCGSPCQMSRKNQKHLDQHLNGLAQEMRDLNEKYYDEVMIKGGFMSFDGSIKSCDERCSLLVEDEGVHKCMAHKYALEHEIAIYEFCPLSCLMYPLEIIELITDKKRKVILLTSVVEEDLARNYGRWGSYKGLNIDHRCINKETHNEIFKLEDYKPVYEVNKNLMDHEFGKEVYKGLEIIFNK